MSYPIRKPDDWNFTTYGVPGYQTDVNGQRKSCYVPIQVVAIHSKQVPDQMFRIGVLKIGSSSTVIRFDDAFELEKKLMALRTAAETCRVEPSVYIDHCNEVREFICDLTHGPLPKLFEPSAMEEDNAEEAGEYLEIQSHDEADDEESEVVHVGGNSNDNFPKRYSRDREEHNSRHPRGTYACEYEEGSTFSFY